MIAYGEDYAAMSFSEIARALGVSSPAVQATYHRAMRKIRSDRQAMEQLRWLLQERERTKPATVYPEWV